MWEERRGGRRGGRARGGSLVPFHRSSDKKTVVLPAANTERGLAARLISTRISTDVARHLRSNLSIIIAYDLLNAVK